MSADEHLSSQQFAAVADLHKMYSGDWDEPMHRVGHVLRERYNAWENHETDSEPPQTEMEHDGPDGYVDHLAKDIRQNGMHEPIEVRGGNVVTDGHHRYLAAVRAGLKQVPVRHVR